MIKRPWLFGNNNGPFLFFEIINRYTGTCQIVHRGCRYPSPITLIVTFYITLILYENQEISFGKMCLHISMPFSQMCKFVWLPPQVRYRIVLSPQISLSCTLSPHTLSHNPEPMITTTLFSICIILSFWEGYRNGII